MYPEEPETFLIGEEEYQQDREETRRQNFEYTILSNRKELENILREIHNLTRNQGRFPDKTSYEFHMEAVHTRQRNILGKIYNLIRPLLDQEEKIEVRPVTLNSD